jgi:hypothetical protein
MMIFTFKRKLLKFSIWVILFFSQDIGELVYTHILTQWNDFIIFKRKNNKTYFY